MKQWWVIFQKEQIELYRNYKWIWVPIVFALLGMMQPLTTYYLPQILEPKITGDSLGVSAFTMLVFMIISLSIFGISGFILSPVLIILIKALYDQGYIQQWIRKPEDY